MARASRRACDEELRRCGAQKCGGVEVAPPWSARRRSPRPAHTAFVHSSRFIPSRMVNALTDHGHNSSDTHNALATRGSPPTSRLLREDGGPGDCLRGDRGSWASPREAHVGPRRPRASRTAPVPRCQHVSVSRCWSDCSWFHACITPSCRQGQRLRAAASSRRWSLLARREGRAPNVAAQDNHRSTPSAASRASCATAAATSAGGACSSPSPQTRGEWRPRGASRRAHGCGPMGLLLAPDIESCTEPGAVPCAYTTKFAGWGGDPPIVWDLVMRLRTYYLAVLRARPRRDAARLRPRRLLQPVPAHFAAVREGGTAHTARLAARQHGHRLRTCPRRACRRDVAP